MRTLVGRYALEDRLAEGDGWSSWRGFDGVLRRPVEVLVLPLSDPRCEDVLAGARDASRVSDPRFRKILDVLEDGSAPDGVVALVSEWVPGADLEQLLAHASDDPAADSRAGVRAVQEVAEALAAAAQQGLHHGALAPSDVRVDAEGRVRVAGLEVAAALDRVPAVARDEATYALALGALLHATLTGLWAGTSGRCSLPPCPVQNGRPVRPRAVRAGVPGPLDQVAARSLGSAGRQQPLVTPALLADALAEARRRVAAGDRGGREQDVPVPAAPVDPRPGPGAARLALRVVLVAAVVGLLAVAGLVGYRQWDRARAARLAAPTSTPLTPSPRPSADVVPVGTIPVTAVTDFDPAGNGAENPALAPLAVDGKPGTAWRTVTYKRADLGGLKPGVGLLLDLGTAQDVGAVRLSLVGRGTSVELRAASARSPRFEDYILVAQSEGTGDQVTLRPDPRVRARYLLVWLTRLPADGPGYRGGVSEITVLRS